MSHNTLFSFLLFMFHLFPLLIFTESSSCPTTFDCPGLGPLEFPLSNITHPDCGLFTVNCTNSSNPLLQMQSGGKWYQILHKISTNKFSVRDQWLQDLLHSNSCLSFFNRSLPTTPFTSFAISPNLTVFTCFSTTGLNEMNHNFERHNCSDATVYYRNPANNSAVNHSVIPHPCVETEVPIINPAGQYPSELFQLISSNFTLEWDISDECMSCHEKGGQCTTNTMNEFFCRTTVHAPGNGNSISSWTIVGSGLGALFTIVLVVVILLWKGRCSQRKDTLEYGVGPLEFPLSNMRGCGLFTVKCTNSSTPSLQLESGGFWYQILQMISPNKFVIHDPRLQNWLNLNSCLAFTNRSLPTTPFTSFSISPNLTVFTCFSTTGLNEMNHNFERHNCSDATVYYRNPANNSAVNHSVIPHPCVETEVPIINPAGQYPSELFQLISSNFTLEWDISDECMSCHEKGGQCTTNTMNEFFCRTTVHAPGNGNSISSWTIVGSGLGALFTIVLVVVILLWKGRCSQRKDTLEYELRGVKFQTSSFTYHQIKTATQDFSPANKIGEGGFGPVYKGTFSDGTVVAVKQLSSRSRQGNREFVTEIGMISALEHPNLVKLYGCCVHGNNLLLIYEHMENNSLARALFGSEDQKLNLDWPTRHKICVGVARGLAFLHEESALKIVHRDIKASNVLLDENLIPKISDFGLARLQEEDETHISTRIAGTLGYMAPEYALNGYLTDKADVYSFGVVLLEVVSGRANILMPGEEFNLLGWAKFLSQNDNVMELVDPRLESTDKEEILATINIALICTNFVGAERPSMSTVVSMLTGSSSASLSAP